MAFTQPATNKAKEDIQKWGNSASGLNFSKAAVQPIQQEQANQPYDPNKYIAGIDFPVNRPATWVNDDYTMPEWKNIKSGEQMPQERVGRPPDASHYMSYASSSPDSGSVDTGYTDWGEQVPGILNDIIGKLLADKNIDPNAADLTSLWFGDIISNTPNLSRAYTENVNSFLEGLNQRLGGTNNFLNSILGQYSNLSQNTQNQFNNLFNYGGQQSEDLNRMISKLGPEFANALAKQSGEYNYFANQGINLNDLIANKYGQLGGISDQVTKNIIDAYRGIQTGEVSDASKQYVDQIFNSNQDIINRNFDDTMESQRQQLVDDMAGRGILTSGVTSRAYGDITEAALKEKQKSMSEIAAQRAATMLDLPYKQAQYANQLNQHIDTLKGLTQAEIGDLTNMLTTQYGMSKADAELAIANLTSKYSQENQARSTQNQLYNILTNYDSNTQANLASQLAQQGAFGNQNLQLQQAMAQAGPDTLAKMFDQYGTLSNNFFKTLIDRELGHLQAQVAAGNKPEGSNPLLGLAGAVLGGSGCVRKGTIITMADRTFKKAEEIQIGDKLRSFDTSTNTYSVSTVESITKTKFTHYYRTTLLNEFEVDASSYHPFLVFTNGKYKFGLVKYWHAIRNLLKHVILEPKKIMDSIKFSLLAISRYSTLKTLSRVMIDNFENSVVKSIKKVSGEDLFYNFRTGRGEPTTFIANGIILEALYEETEKFVNWVSEEGESFDRG